MNKYDFKGPSNRYIAPQMENIDQGEHLAFTISPARLTVVSKHVRPDGEPVNWCKQVICDLIAETNFCKYEDIHVEVSSQGRLHMHGYMTVTNKLMFYTHDIPALKEIGSFCIKKLFIVNDHPEDEAASGSAEWDNYIEKQSDEWVEYFEEHSFKYPDSMVDAKYPFNFPPQSKQVKEYAFDPLD